MSEVVKHALIEGEDMTRRIESSEWDSVESTTGGSTDDLEDLVARAVQVKVDIVAEDPLDEARRQVLNLGHTFAYAFESAMLGDVSHGEAVGIGLVAASRLSARLGLCDPPLHDRVQHLVRHVGQHTSLPRPIAMDAVDRAFAHDKKRRGEEQRFVLLERIGSPVVMAVDDRAAVWTRSSPCSRDGQQLLPSRRLARRQPGTSDPAAEDAGARGAKVAAVHLSPAQCPAGRR